MKAVMVWVRSFMVVDGELGIGEMVRWWCRWWAFYRFAGGSYF